MWREEVEQVWQQLWGEVILEIKEWRLQHPKARFKEIEEAVDGRLGRARARLMQDVALASEAAKVESEEREARCSQCGHPLESRGQKVRKLTTHYD